MSTHLKSKAENVTLNRFFGGKDRGPVEFQCPHCDYEMKVEERVMRSFEIVEED